MVFSSIPSELNLPIVVVVSYTRERKSCHGQVDLRDIFLHSDGHRAEYGTEVSLNNSYLSVDNQ
jgi:hypothetical protein